METALLFKEVLDIFDSAPFQLINESDVYNKIQVKIGPDKTEFTTEESAELIAFHSPATYGNDFRFLQKITPEMIEYWEERSANVKHPLLIARYSGLVHEYSFAVRKVKPNHEISRKHVNALIDQVNKKLYSVPIYAKNKICRSLEIAIKMNDKNSIEKSKEAMIKVEKEIAINDKPGLWGFSYDLLIAGSKKIANVEEENKIIDELEARLVALIKIDSWAMECVVERLTSYYFKNKKYYEIKRVLFALEETYEFAMQKVAIIQQVDFLEKLFKFYKRFEIREEALRILIRLRSLSKEANKEFRKISSSLDIPRWKMENFADLILDGNDTEKIFIRIVEYNTPSIEEVRKELLRQTKQSPIQSLFARSILDSKGRKIANVGTFSENPDDHLILHFSYSIRIGTIFLDFVFKEGFKREIFTTHEIIKFLAKSCIIEPARIVIFNKGIEAYFNDEYIIAIHLLIPQFEQAIRNLIEMNGGSILVEKDGVFKLKTFEHILSDSIVKEVFGDDKVMYFKVLFTDNKGWNLRNDFAHGLLDIEHFNKQNVERIIHAVLCLGIVRLNNDSKN